MQRNRQKAKFHKTDFVGSIFQKNDLKFEFIKR